MDIITLALANKYTDEKIASVGGGSGGVSVPHFDLAAMGLPTIQLGSTVEIESGDFTALKKAMKDGLVHISFNLDLGWSVIPVEGALSCFSSEVANMHQGSAIMFYTPALLVFVLSVTDYDSLRFEVMVLGA